MGSADAIHTVLSCIKLKPAFWMSHAACAGDSRAQRLYRNSERYLCHCMMHDSIGREVVQSVATASADVTGFL